MAEPPAAPPPGGGGGDPPARADRPATSVPGAGDADGAARPSQPPRAFAVGYERQSGDMLVYGGFAVAAIGVVATLVNGAAVFLVATVAGLISAAYFWPLTERSRPQLGASTAGLYVDRIGIIGWPAIEALDVEQTALRTMQLAKLKAKLRVPLDQAVVTVEEVSLAKRFTTRNWKLVGDVLEVQLHTLTGHPPEVFERIRVFHDLSSMSARDGAPSS